MGCQATITIKVADTLGDIIFCCAGSIPTLYGELQLLNCALPRYYPIGSSTDFARLGGYGFSTAKVTYVSVVILVYCFLVVLRYVTVYIGITACVSTFIPKF